MIQKFKEHKNIFTQLLVLFVCAIVITLIIEVFVFNFSYFRYGKIDNEVKNIKYENLVQTDTNTYKLVDSKQSGKIILGEITKGTTKLLVKTSIDPGNPAKIIIPNKECEERKIQNSLETINVKN